MGKASVILVAIFSMLGAYYTMNAQRHLVEADDRLAGHQWELLARNAARASMERAKQNLIQNFDASAAEVSGSYQNIPYEVKATAAASGERIAVKATGTAAQANGKPVPFTVRAVYEKRPEVPEEVPAFQRYAIMAEEDIHMNGGA